jgi:hypothetical protein
MALAGTKQQFKVRHTQKTEGRVAEAQRVLGLTMAHMDAFEDMATELFQTSITNQQFDNLFEALYPKPEADSKGATTLWEKKFDLTRGLYLSSPTQTGITGTAWGALNALTERVDYYREGRGGNEGILAAASGFEAGVNTEKARILSAVRGLVSA